MESLNWTAVIVGTIVAFLVGWLWYSPRMFGNKWAEGSGVNLDSADKMPAFAMTIQLVALFLLALVIGVTATTDALGTAVLAILAAAAFVAAGSSFSQKTNYAIGVEAGYIVVAGIVMILAQGIF